MGRSRKKGKKTADRKRIRSKTTDKLQVLLAEVTDMQARETERAAELERFRECDLPKFTQWMDTTHAEKRKRLTAILDEVEILELAFAKAEFAYHKGMFRSEAEAVVATEKGVRDEFTRLEAEEDHSDSDSPSRPPDDVVDLLFEIFLEEVKGIDPDELDPETHDRYRADFEATLDHAAEGDYAAFDTAMARLAASDDEESQSATKTLFRRLVRRLHPDHHPDFGEFEKSLWNEAMKCYEQFDAEGLERIELRLQIHLGQDITPAQTPALRRYRDFLEMQLEDMLDELEEAKSHPGWGFSLRRKTKAFLKSIQEQLDDAISEASFRLRDLKDLFNQAKRSVSQPKSRGAKKRSVAKKKAPKRKSAARTEAPPLVQEEFPF